MTQEEFNRVVGTFDDEEAMRSALYHRALSLITAGFVVDAHILILAPWNFARFRYAMTTFDLAGYENTIERLGRDLAPLASGELMTLDLGNNRNVIVAAFDGACANQRRRIHGGSKDTSFARAERFRNVGPSDHGLVSATKGLCQAEYREERLLPTPEVQQERSWLS
jgi:hypothetical protein